jgi:hypothetical protein
MASDYEAASARLAAARRDLDLAERDFAVAQREKDAADHEQLVADLAECGYALSAGIVGRAVSRKPEKFIAQGPYGQITAYDPETLLRRARGKVQAAASLQGAA